MQNPGASPPLQGGDRAIRSNSSDPRGVLRDFRFYPLRGLPATMNRGLFRPGRLAVFAQRPGLPMTPAP
jgi:hypothetical protein